jgi:formamidopyrimidine-DNA glycosylase
MAYKKYTKKDFLEFASGFDYFKTDEDKFKKMTLKEFRDFYNFTHRNEEQGLELDVRNFKGINCQSCGEILRPDYRNTNNINYCGNC